jgi:hypothetical protein
MFWANTLINTMTFSPLRKIGVKKSFLRQALRRICASGAGRSVHFKISRSPQHRLTGLI